MRASKDFFDVMLKYSYPLGDAAYNGDWDRYWNLHAKMRKECWSKRARVLFRLGAINRWVRGDKWKP